MVYNVMWRNMLPIKPGTQGANPLSFAKCTGFFYASLHITQDQALYVPSEGRSIMIISGVMVYNVMWRNMLPIKPGTQGANPLSFAKCTGFFYASLHITQDQALYVPSEGRSIMIISVLLITFVCVIKGLWPKIYTM